MKFTIEDVQVAIKGMMKYSNQCISDQLLAVVAGNYAKANNIIILRLQSPYEEYDQPVIGEIKTCITPKRPGKPSCAAILFSIPRNWIYKAFSTVWRTAACTCHRVS
ncbi:hypothetical protein P4B63_001196 [Salmonella enterica subsp. diarizonae]|nr:hypothetical protein [Salmonella enterica subsp. diarizonae]